MIHFLRIYPSALAGLSSFVLDLEWSRVGPFAGQVSCVGVRDLLEILLMGLSPDSWWSLVDTVVYKGEVWTGP